MCLGGTIGPAYLTLLLRFALWNLESWARVELLACGGLHDPEGPWTGATRSGGRTTRQL